MRFLLFLWLYFFISWISFGEIFQHFHSTSHPARYWRILNTKKLRFVKAVFSIFSNLCLLPLPKYWFIDFPGKRAPTKVKYLLTVCQMLRKLEQIHCQFCFLCSYWRNKISQNTDVSLWARADYLNFHPQRASDRKTIGSRDFYDNFFSDFSLVLVSTEKIYQSLKTVLDHISKHLDFCQK